MQRDALAAFSSKGGCAPGSGYVLFAATLGLLVTLAGNCAKRKIGLGFRASQQPSPARELGERIDGRVALQRRRVGNLAREAAAFLSLAGN